jgi:hypothetical protein
MTNTTRALPLVLAAAAVLATPACGFTISTTPAAAPVTSTATSTPADTVRPVEMAEPVAGTEDLSLDDAAELIRPYLLTADEVGPGFTTGAEPRPDASVPAICGGPNTVAQYPVAVRVGAAFDGPVTGVQVTETVSVFGDAATAEAAYRAGVDGLSCSEGTVAGEPVAIAPAEDLTFDVGGEQATGWILGNADVDVIVVTVQDDVVLWNFTYLAAGGTFDELPDALEVSADGVAKFAG